MYIPEKFIIAVDGYSSCGKSTLAKELAKELGFIYIDTGAMYRAVTLFALDNDVFGADDQINENLLRSMIDDIKIEFKINAEQRDTILNGEIVSGKIRSPQVSNRVSLISKLKFVRERLVALQREMGDAGRVILDGRDIGTVVFPKADLKIFMTASIEVRTNRRWKEMKLKYPNVTFDEVKENLTERDRMDTTRKESPLKRAEDAKLIDNSELDRKQQLQVAIDLVEKTTEI
ncbi:MAG: (d)CMP kinase [Bacteroidales bacterium]|nr:(d)CMP kinase [Bacteroidales bacterium]